MLMQLTVKFGSRFRMIAVFTSVMRTRIDVEIAGKPKPSAPCVRPAANIAAAAAAHIQGLRASSDSMDAPRSVSVGCHPPLQRVRAVAAAEAGERAVHAAAEREHLEELAHF